MHVGPRCNTRWLTCGVWRHSAMNRWFSARGRPVYLVDFSTFKPPEDWKLSHAQLMEIMKRKKCFTDQSLEFMERVLANSGTGKSPFHQPSKPFEPSSGSSMCLACLSIGWCGCSGPSTAWPPGTVKCLLSEDIEADQTEEAARAEAEVVILSAVKVRPGIITRRGS